MRRIPTTRMAGLFTALAVVLLVLAAAWPQVRAADKPLARNVILLIDDGAGYNHHVAGSLYDTGLREGEAYNDFPFRFAVTTYSYGDKAVGACGELVGYDAAQAWSDFGYVYRDPTDSAAAATALATGVKTYDKAIGVDCAGTPHENVVEAFEALGKSTGVVTSVPVSHATPAAFVVHNVARDSFHEIAADMIHRSSTDVIMGAGHPYFNQKGAAAKLGDKWIGIADWDALVAGTAGGDADADGDNDPWTLVQTRAEFQALMTGSVPGRVFGVAQVKRSLQVDRGTSEQGSAPPFTVPFIETVPTLSEMATGALNVLEEDPDGFFLMIEGGATDLASHAGRLGRMVEEEIAFDRAVDVVLGWVDEHSNWGETLVIVTSDHETGLLTGPGSGSTPDGPVWTELVDNGIGVVPGMQLNLPPPEQADEDGKFVHANTLVPVFAKGDAARLLRRAIDGADPVHGFYIDNTDIHQLIVDAVAAPSREG